jgi:hypothetical protein
MANVVFCTLLCVSRHVRKMLVVFALASVVVCGAVCCFGAGHDSVLLPWQITDRPFNGTNWPICEEKSCIHRTKYKKQKYKIKILEFQQRTLCIKATTIIYSNFYTKTKLKSWKIPLLNKRKLSHFLSIVQNSVYSKL